MPYLYEYMDDVPRDFPTLGLREVQKGQQITSDEPLNSPFLKEVTAKKVKTESTEKAGGE